MGFWAWLGKLKLIKSLWKIIKYLISGTTEIILAQLKELAVDAVLMVKKDPSLVTNEDKRNKAFDIIKESALERGVQIQTHLINLAIELALGYLKKAGRI